MTEVVNLTTVDLDPDPTNEIQALSLNKIRFIINGIM